MNPAKEYDIIYRHRLERKHTGGKRKEKRI